MRIILFYLAIFTFSISCKNKQEVVDLKTEIQDENNTLISFDNNGIDFVYEDYLLKSNQIDNSFELYINNKFVDKIDFEQIEYDGPGFLVYLSELENGFKNIIIEATADVGTAWYYSVLLKDNMISNQFFIYEPRTDSEKYSLNKFMSISIKENFIKYKFDKNLISKYSLIPKEAIIDGNNIYLNIEVKNENIDKSNEQNSFMSEINNYTNYTLVYEKSLDLNLDGIQDKLFVLKNNLEFDSDNEETKESKIVVFISDGNSFKKTINTTIFPNDANDQFETIDFKDNYFTVKLFNEVPNEYFIEKFITFKVVKNTIKLNKFSKVINEKQTNIDVSKIDEILFEDYNSNNDLFK